MFFLENKRATRVFFFSRFSAQFRQYFVSLCAVCRWTLSSFIFQMPILPLHVFQILLFSLQHIYGLCHSGDLVDTTAPNLSILPSKYHLVSHVLHTSLMRWTSSWSTVKHFSEKALRRANYKKCFTIIIECFRVKLDYMSSQKCPWVYCSSEWFFNTKYDTHKIWPFQNIV